MRRSWFKIIGNFVLLSALACLALSLVSCASKPGTLIVHSEEEAASRNLIVLRTGQTCEVENMKIVACERNTFRYAETKHDIEAMKEDEN